VQKPEEELNGTTFQIYLFLVKAGEATGPRDIMRGTDITSPGVVHRHLQKLADLGLVEKDAYGRYTAKAKVGFKGYVWFGKNLFPRFILYSFFFIGLLSVLIAVLALHLWTGSSVEESFTLLTAVTAVAAVAFMAEGLLMRKRMSKQPNIA
jgi:hypothetical protein